MPESAPSYSLLISGVLLFIFGPIAVIVLGRLMGGAPAWAWRLAAFLCLMAGWAIVLLNEPIKTQVKLHPRGYAIATFGIFLVAILIVRSRLFDEAADFKGDIRAVYENHQFMRDTAGLHIYFVTINLSLVNRGVDTNIDKFSLEYTIRGAEHYSGQTIPSADFVLDERVYFKMGQYQTKRQELSPDLDTRKAETFARNHGLPGWLSFEVRNVRWSGLGNDLPKSMKLIIVDGLGDSHEILCDLPKEGSGKIRWRNEPLKPPSTDSTV